MSENIYNKAISETIEEIVRNDDIEALNQEFPAGYEDKLNSFTTNKDGANLLMLAAKYGARKIFNKLIIECNIDINKKDKKGNNVLHYLFSNIYGNGELPIEKMDIFTLLRRDNLNIYKKDCIDELIDRKNNDGVKPFVLLKNRELIEGICSNYSKDFIKAGNLLKAAELGNLEIVRYLVENGIDINTKDKYNRTPLYMAIKGDNIEIVKYLINEMGVDASSLDYETLSDVVDNNNLEMLEFLTKRGAKLTVQNNDGNTLLHKTAENGNFGFFEYLNKRGNIRNIANNIKDTLLYMAVMGDNVEIVKYFVDHGADLNVKDELLGTPLFMAVENNNINIVQYLVNNGANINAKDKSSNTPLLIAAKNGNLDILKYLINNGANINIKNKFYNASLHMAAKSDNVEVVRYLVSLGADINMKNKFHNTPLHIAVKYGNVDVIKYLIGHGANLDIQNCFGKTPDQIAIINGNNTIAQEIIAERQKRLDKLTVAKDEIQNVTQDITLIHS